MKKKAFIILSLFYMNCFAQEEKVMVEGNEVKVPAGTCYYFFIYDEVKIKNPEVQLKINNSIKTEADKYKLEAGALDDYCNQKIGFEQEAKIVWSKNNIVSVFFNNTYVKEGSSGTNLHFSSKNYDAKTGNEIPLHDLFNSDSTAKADSLIMKKFKEEYSSFLEDYHHAYFVKQLAGIDYNLFKKGIKILFRGENSLNAMLEIYITFEEMKPFLKKESSLLALAGK